MNAFEARQIFDLVQKTNISEAFKLVDAHGVSHPQLEVLRREFIHGNYKYDFYERLQMCLNLAIKTNFEIVPPQIDIFFSFSSKNQA